MQDLLAITIGLAEKFLDEQLSDEDGASEAVSYTQLTLPTIYSV